MQILNPVIIKNPLNWAIVILMMVLAAFIIELLMKASGGNWDCGCNS